MARSLRVPLRGLVPGEVELDAPTARYVVRVRRLSAGQRFVAFDPERAVEADAEIRRVEGPVVCGVGALRPAAALPPYDVTVLQCVGKADKPDRVVRDATALGARRIVFVESSRVVARLGERSERRRSRWAAIAAQSSRQAGRGDVPAVQGPLPFDAALDAVASTRSRKLCLASAAERSLDAALAGWTADEPVVVLVGPEGGLSEAELERASGAGYLGVSLGPFVLRTETAVVAVLGAIAARGSAARGEG